VIHPFIIEPAIQRPHLSEEGSKGVHLVIVPYVGRSRLIRRFVSTLGSFVALDLDCYFPSFASYLPPDGAQVLVEGGDLLNAIVDVYSLPKSDSTIVVNSLNTIQAFAKVTFPGKDWNRAYFRYLVYFAAACRARSPSVFLLYSLYRTNELRGMNDKKWFRPYRGLVDDVMVLGEGGLTPLS